MAKKNKTKQSTIKKYRKPDEDTRDAYNKEIQNLIKETNTAPEKIPLEVWAEIIQTAAANTLTEIPKAQKQPYIKEDTWDLLQRKTQAKENRDWEMVKTLEKQIRLKVRSDKENYRLEQLQEIDEQGYK